jgi:osomolarity two-component system, response regulator SSK1
MARFRPSKLFRRFSSRSDVHSPNKSRSVSQHSPSPPHSSEVPSPRLGLQPARTASIPPSSRQLRKSSSLPRLRKRSGTQGTAKSGKSAGDGDREREDSVPEVPEVIREARESVDLLAQHRVDLSGSEEKGLSVSEGETESVGKSSGRVDSEEQKEAIASAEDLRLEKEDLQQRPIVVVEQPTPDVVEEVRVVQQQESPDSRQFDTPATTASISPEQEPGVSTATTAATEISQPARTVVHHPQQQPGLAQFARKPSIVDSANAKIVKTLIDAPSRRQDRSTSDPSPPLSTSATEYFARNMPSMATMLHRKIWVRRPDQSATLVQIKEDDLVDDVRDMILRKYANSLGKTFDAPDMTLQVLSRAEQGSAPTIRTLGPEEEMCRTIDQMYPGGQTVNEALIINVPTKRTPKPSPRFQMPYQQPNYYAMDDFRPLENGNDYFPPMPVQIPATIPQTASSHDSRSSQHHHAAAAAGGPATAGPATAEHYPRSMTVLTTGQLPPLPSPGGGRRHHNRPKYIRQPTSSPTILSHPNAGAVAVQPSAGQLPQMVHRSSARPRLDSSASEAAHRPNGIAVPAPPPLPTPPAPEAGPTNRDNSAPPTPSAAVAPVGLGGHGRVGRPKKPRKTTPENTSGTATSRRKKESSSASSPHPSNSIASMLDASVPPINVLIVEDNIINLRILEGLMKRLKVRWQTAMNGQIAVDKWKAGGFHLVLMDIQMPVMNGLQATKEIRRLERANSIGVFSSTSPDEDENAPNGTPNSDKKDNEPSKSDDSLPGLSEGLIKSPVIIVALTASSLQSDRHEALAAGCNDFLTKPVNFVWLERKVKEWGCMQALIDFDGWRKWKEYAAKEEAGKTEEERQKEREKEQKEKVRMEKVSFGPIANT